MLQSFRTKLGFLSFLKSLFILNTALLIFVSAILFAGGTHVSDAAIDPDPIRYEGRLLDRNRNAITAEHVFRFSLWDVADYLPSHVTNQGNINTNSGNYEGWQEVQNILPNPNGTFTIDLGAVNPFPTLNTNNTFYLQVEVKAVGQPNTLFQLLDPTGDSGVDSNDRKLLDSSPYTKYADTATSAKGSNDSLFLLDADDTAADAGTGTVRLQFGNSLLKYLQFDLDEGYFFFNDNVRIAGDLTVDGLINGVDITNLSSSTHGQNTDSGTTSTTFFINSGGDSLLLSAAGLTGDRTITFPDQDIVVVGEDSAQTLSNKTIDGESNTFSNIDRNALKDRNRTLILMPQLDSISIEEDGNGNIASLSQGYDSGNKQQYYVLTSQEPTLQNLDLIIPFVIPDDFSGLQATPITVDVRTTSLDSADAQLDVSLEDSLNAAAPLTGADDLTSTVTSDSWREYSIDFAGSPTFNAGGKATLSVKLSARNGNRAILGPIHLYYIGK